MDSPELYRPQLQARDLHRLLLESEVLTREQYDQEIGGLRGLARGIKPAVFSSPEVVAAVMPVLRLNGLEVVANGGLLYRADLVEQCIQTDPAAVIESHWDVNKTVPENVASSSADARGVVDDQLRMGFALGYPVTALREYGTHQELRNAGWPMLSDVWRLAEGNPGIKGLWTDINLDTADFAMLADIKERCARMRAELAVLPMGPQLSEEQNKQNAALAEATQTTVTHFIRKHFLNRPGYSDELGARLATMYPRVVQLYDEGQRSIYNFMVFSDEAMSAPDVQALRERVAAPSV